MEEDHRDVEERLDRAIESLGELRGRITSLETQVLRLLNGKSSDPHSGVKTVVSYASIVIVPIIVAILGGYFALKAAGLK